MDRGCDGVGNGEGDGKCDSEGEDGEMGGEGKDEGDTQRALLGVVAGPDNREAGTSAAAPHEGRERFSFSHDLSHTLLLS